MISNSSSVAVSYIQGIIFIVAEMYLQHEKYRNKSQQKKATLKPCKFNLIFVIVVLVVVVAVYRLFSIFLFS